MKRNIRKIKKYLLFAIASFSLCFSVNASPTLICSWTEKINNVNNQIVSTSIELRYDGSNDMFIFEIPDSCQDTKWDCDKTTTISASVNEFTKAKNGSNKYIQISDTAYNNFIVNGQCPSQVFYDLYNAQGGHAGDDEICIGDDLYCTETVGGNKGHNFKSYNGGDGAVDSVRIAKNNLEAIGRIVSTDVGNLLAKKYKVNTSLSYDQNEICKKINEDPESFSTEYEKEVNGFITEALKSRTYPTTATFTDLLKANISNNSKIQDKYGLSALERSIRDDCTRVVNNSSLTDEEKDNLLEGIDSGLENVSENIQGAFASITWHFNADFSGDVDCGGLFGNGDSDTPLYYIRLAFKLVRYVAIILALVLSIIDFAKAVFSQDKDLLQKAGISAAKRLIFAVVIFFLPVLINFALGIIDSRYSTCL